MATNKTLLGFVQQQSYKEELAWGFTQGISPPPATENVELQDAGEIEDPKIKKIICTPRIIPDRNQPLDLSRNTGRTLGHHTIQPLDANIIPLLDGYNPGQLETLTRALTADPQAEIHLSRRTLRTLFHSHVRLSHLAVLCFLLRGDGRDEGALR